MTRGRPEVGLLFAKGEKERGTLSRRLLDLAEAGHTTRCQDPATGLLWLSDDHEDRALAATLMRRLRTATAMLPSSCQQCVTHVWAVHDWTVHPGQ
jgi:hypothetical protein